MPSNEFLRSRTLQLVILLARLVNVRFNIRIQTAIPLFRVRCTFAPLLELVASEPKNVVVGCTTNAVLLHQVLNSGIGGRAQVCTAHAFVGTRGKFCGWHSRNCKCRSCQGEDEGRLHWRPDTEMQRRPQVNAHLFI